MEKLNYHIKNAVVVDPKSDYHQQCVDLIIEDGVIKEISKDLSSSYPEIASNNLHLSPGWMDLMCRFGEPGYEHKETLESGIACAKAGGFTEVCLMPSTDPVIDNKTGVNFLKKNTLHSGVLVHPIGAISKGMKGENISEMYDMQLGGAVAFSDDKQALSTGVLNRALLYTQNFNGTVFSFPHDPSFGKGQVNEGLASTLSGLSSIPTLAEEIRIERDIALAKYNESGIHFSLISTQRSADLIRQAKEEGLDVSCSVGIMNLLFDDSAIESFDSHYKVMPPLRENEDVEALWAGLNDGTIDAIVSDHTPEDLENKQVEFDHAAFGVIGLESLYSKLNTHPLWDKDLLYSKLIEGPRKVLNREVPSIQKGTRVNLCAYDPDTTWKYDKSLSISSNSPFLGEQLTGKVIKTLVV